MNVQYTTLLLETEPKMKARCVKLRSFAPFDTKMIIILPRQSRDKHIGKALKKERCVFLRRLMNDLEQWMTLGKTHLQGSFASFYLAAHAHHHKQQQQEQQQQQQEQASSSSSSLLGVANGTAQALLLDMASMGPDWKWAHAVNR
jgi:hypothetical protein